MRSESDTNIGSVVNSEWEVFRLKENNDELVGWAMKWQMEFSREKCELMCLGKFKKARE